MIAVDEAVEMFVGGLVLDPNTQAPVVILKDETGTLSLPIWIGVPEATGIASAVKQLSLPRPLTHDLLYEVLNEVGVEVSQIMISDLRDGTYFAELVCRIGDKPMVFDCRPSDAINIAIRSSSPIYVTQAVLDLANVKPVEGSNPEDGENGDGIDPEEELLQNQQQDFKQIDEKEWSEILESLDPDDFKYKT